jgi:hypothetical protein
MQRQLVFITEDWAVWPVSGHALSRQIGCPHGTLFLVITSFAQMHECSEPQIWRSGLCDCSLLSEYIRFAEEFCLHLQPRRTEGKPIRFHATPSHVTLLRSKSRRRHQSFSPPQAPFHRTTMELPCSVNYLVLMTSNTMSVTTYYSDLNLLHSRATPRPLSSVVS